MKHNEISLNTKRTLAASLKRHMVKKPLSKITVSEIIKDCNVNRKTFYYHFENIYYLLKWMFEQEAVDVVKSFDLLINTEEAILFVMEYIEANRAILNNAYDSMGRDEMKRFFYNDFIDIVRKVIEEDERKLGLCLEGNFKVFLVEFYTEALAGILISTFKDDYIASKEETVQNVLLVLKASIPEVLIAKANAQDMYKSYWQAGQVCTHPCVFCENCLLGKAPQSP